ncbi:MFS transporter [Candidatus Dojkabacteria bacterium]|nr:MFS transporter [Candidatus Dojkabacteria bacterium]
MKLFKKYPKEVYILCLASFITGIEFIGAFLIPFFKDWGGLSQFQTQLLQSWFTLLIFLLEIPTGLIGDIKGRKFSVLTGFLFLTIGPIIYGSFPDFRVFLLGEFLFAVGVAFNSGAEEALLYDTMKQAGVEKDFGKVETFRSNLHMIGMLVASAFSGILIEYFKVNQLFQLGAITSALVFILILLFVKEPNIKPKEEFIPDYKTTFKRAVQTIKKNNVLKKLVVYVTFITASTYFVLWFYQTLLQEVNVDEKYFGFYRIALLVSEIVLAYILVNVISGAKNKSFWVRLSAAFIVLGFLAPIFLNSNIGVLVFVILAGGIGLKFREIFSGFLNIHIKSGERATTLSFISMVRRLALTILNPLFGWFADYDMDLTLFVLAGIVVLAGLFLSPSNREMK